MSWFAKKKKIATPLSDNLQVEAERKADAYIEHAKLLHEALRLDPPLSEGEIACHWYYGALTIRENGSKSDDAKVRQMEDMLQSITAIRYESTCKELMLYIAKSSFVLDMDSVETAALIVRHTQESAKNPKRGEAVGQIMMPFVSNAISLATSAITDARMEQETDKDTRELAKSFAIHCLSMRKGLDPWVRTKAHEMLSQ